MSESTPSKNRSLARGLALAVVIASAGGLSFGFAKALRDSVAWRQMSERAVVNPTFEARDPSQAKRIEEFVLKDRRGRP